MKCSITAVIELCGEAKGDSPNTVACKPDSVDGSLQVPGHTDSRNENALSDCCVNATQFCGWKWGLDIQTRLQFHISTLHYTTLTGTARLW